VCSPAVHKKGAPEFVPPSVLAQINRWATVLPAWLFRGLIDLGRPSDISLYHIGCFHLVVPNSHSTPLAAVVLRSLQQQQYSLDETFREAGAMLCIRVPKCKQHEGKRKANGSSAVDWLDLQKPILNPALSLFRPTRTLAFCMAASWFAREAVTARLLGVRRFGTAKAAAKRYQQSDFQQVQGANNWKVPTAGDIHSMTPSLYLLQQKAGSSSDSESSSSDNSDGGSGSDSSGAGSSGDGAGTGEAQARSWLCHTKPRQGSTARITLKLRLLSGYDQRHSLQVRQSKAETIEGVHVCDSFAFVRQMIARVPFADSALQFYKYQQFQRTAQPASVKASCPVVKKQPTPTAAPLNSICIHCMPIKLHLRPQQPHESPMKYTACQLNSTYTHSRPIKFHLRILQPH
jgi:uncharacterized membrane protein YgcG